MATFTGTDVNEIITPGLVSASVTRDPPGSAPSAAIDIINAGGGDDLAIGGGGDDIVDLGDGNDRFFWKEGDGRDTLAGGIGSDELTFEASAGDDFVFMADEGDDRRSLNTAAAASAVDFTGVESILINALEGSDTIVVEHAASAGIDFIYVNLAATPNEIAPDAGADTIFFHGGALADTFAIAGGSTASVTGLGPSQIIADFGGANDNVQMHGGEGDDRISAADYVGPMGISLFGNGGDDALIGGFGDDLLLGEAGNDVVEGRGGNDTARLGDGNDAYNWGVGEGDDRVEGGAGFDRVTVLGTGTTSTFEDFRLELAGSELSVDWDGSGRITLQDVEQVKIAPGGGSDFVFLSGLATGLIDRVDVDLGPEAGDFPDDIRIGAAAESERIVAVQSGTTLSLTGLGARCTLRGLQSHDSFSIFAREGNDIIDLSALRASTAFLTVRGEAGDDVLRAGEGAESFFGGQGTDAVDFTFSAAAVTVLLDISTSFNENRHGFGGSAEGDFYVEVENLIGSAFGDLLRGDGMANALAGAGGADQLYGRDGDDRLDGGAGADRGDGGAGDDTHFVDHADDLVFERAAEGSDRIVASVSHALAAGSHVEWVTTARPGGTEAIDLTGNGIANRLVGNAGANRLLGGGGDDILSGLAGNDLLRGGAGADRGFGGAGDDTHQVDSAADIVVERAGEGADRVLASVSYALRAGVHVETLSTGNAAGTAAINLTGNEFANAIAGNAGSNILTGRGAADRLTGGAGADRFRLTDTADSAVGAARDTIMDFEGAGAVGGDRIDLARIDAVAGGADDAFAFIGSAAFTAAGQVRAVYNPATGLTIVSGNTDATLAADFQIALLGDHTAMNSADFIL